MSLTIDLNSDLGESFGAYKIGRDEDVLKIVSSANVACGYHAGDPSIMQKTVKWAKENNVGIGAHPGFPDMMGFGRRALTVTPEEVYQMVLYQIGALHGFCRVENVEMQHVKAHGALYNMAAKDFSIARAIARTVKDFDPDLILFGLANSELINAAEEVGIRSASEVFADRTYQPDGTLTPRSEENAVIHDEETAIKQVLSMVQDNKVTAVDGSQIEIKVDTVCVHGDSPSALQFVEALRDRFKEESITVQKVGASL
ncbi:LamB/YcsF family protein [Pseudalkalibacillus caeni]|uniref:5-oxoprolinase subunit A n=1 Tax=Exobacillus caeni TaxID=2574798 RepID=A0A5R9F248_9BACL|nr:5-oxoprolinase subunit PxpA [Pseudalkalibacillus caeni]TLS36609.1 LamB/YcsF family protein [Pseudalkalibacillus caeni]